MKLKNKKKVARSFLALLTMAGVLSSTILLFPGGAQAAPDTELYFSPASQSVAIDTDFDLVAMIDPTTTNEIGAVELRISFDASELRLDGITPSAVFSDEMPGRVIDNINGLAAIDLGVPSAPYVTAVETIATFHFHSISTVINSPVLFTTLTPVGTPALTESVSVDVDPIETGDVTATRTGATVTVTSADATDPIISEVAAIGTTTDTTPNYTFNSDEAGIITYGGDCASSDISATIGDNTVTFNALAVGTHSNCTITVTDPSDNVSNTLTVSSFTITVPVVADSDDGDNDKVVKPRRIGNTPKKVSRGKVVVSWGKKFSKNSKVAVYFSKGDGTYYKPRIVKTNQRGRFYISYLVPNSKASGTYKWYAVDLKTGWKSKVSSYKVR